MVTRPHQTEWLVSCRTIYLRFVGVLQGLNNLIPIGLMLGYVMAKLGKNRVVELFHLAIGLEMLGGGRPNSDAKVSTDRSEELGDKQGSTIG